MRRDPVDSRDTDTGRGFTATVTIDSAGPPWCWNPTAVVPPGSFVCMARFACAAPHVQAERKEKLHESWSEWASDGEPSRRCGSGSMLVGPHSTRRVSLAGDFDRVCRPVLSRVRPKRFPSHEERHVQGLGRVLHLKTPRAPSHLCTDGVPCPVPRRRRSGPRRLALSQAPHLRPPRTRGQTCDSRVRRRSGLRMLTFSGSRAGTQPLPSNHRIPHLLSRRRADFPVMGMRSAHSRVGRSYTACMAGSIISKETSSFETTFSFSSGVDVPNTSW